MPIIYSIHTGGHFIHAIARSPLTAREFIDYEISHAIDERIKLPVSELLEISANALKNITTEDIKRVLIRRIEIDRPPTPHRCAILLDSLDDYNWELAKFYEGMAMLHSPERVIVFANAEVAKKWLGFEDFQPGIPDEDNSQYSHIIKKPTKRKKFYKVTNSRRTRGL